MMGQMGSPWNGMNSAADNGMANPVMNQLNQQFEVTQKLLKQHELESELLQHEIKNMHHKQEADKTKASRQELQGTLRALRSKLSKSGVKNISDGISDDISTTKEVVTHQNELDDFEKEERKLLALISAFPDDTSFLEQLRSLYVCICWYWFMSVHVGPCSVHSQPQKFSS